MKQKADDFEEYLDFIKLLTQNSTKIIKKYFRGSYQIEIKSDRSPVTIADKKVEEMMRELIIKEYPEHGILGEEFGHHNPDAEFKWVLDPIDGTKSFVCGVPIFGTLIALMKNGRPLLGVINLPILNEMLIGNNEKTELNGQQVKVRECENLYSAVLLTTDHLHHAQYGNTQNFEKLIKKVQLYRSWGDCFGYYLLATGYADIMVDPIMSSWDTMALIPIIKGAGGRISDYSGKDPLKGDSIVASNEKLHSQVISLMNE
jgi:myo-inositol-1(or 4)-monophosphatase